MKKRGVWLTISEEVWWDHSLGILLHFNWGVVGTPQLVSALQSSGVAQSLQKSVLQICPILPINKRFLKAALSFLEEPKWWSLIVSFALEESVCATGSIFCWSENANSWIRKEQSSTENTSYRSSKENKTYKNASSLAAIKRDWLTILGAALRAGGIQLKTGYYSRLARLAGG